MQDKLSLLEPDAHYHIYNRANGNDKLFKCKENYYIFLKKYSEFISPICDTFSYCLMPNHFHFLVKIKSEEILRPIYNPNLLFLTPKDLNSPKDSDLKKFISKKFSNFFSSYTQYFNLINERKGSLFMKNFKRKKVNNSNYRNKLIHYIHFNPVEAGLTKNPYNYEFSSLSKLISNQTSLLDRKEVISWFDDLENFKQIHKNPCTVLRLDQNIFPEFE